MARLRNGQCIDDCGAVQKGSSGGKRGKGFKKISIGSKRGGGGGPATQGQKGPGNSWKPQPTAAAPPQPPSALTGGGSAYPMPAAAAGMPTPAPRTGWASMVPPPPPEEEEKKRGWETGTGHAHETEGGINHQKWADVDNEDVEFWLGTGEEQSAAADNANATAARPTKKKGTKLLSTGSYTSAIARSSTDKDIDETLQSLEKKGMVSARRCACQGTVHRMVRSIYAVPNKGPHNKSSMILNTPSHCDVFAFYPPVDQLLELWKNHL